MLKQIKTLGLVLVIGSILVGCDSEVSEVELEDTTIESTQEQEEKESEVKEETKEESKAMSKNDEILAIYEALEKFGDEFDWEQTYLDYYAETGNTVDQFIVEMTAVAVDAIAQDCTTMSEEEITDIVSEYMVSMLGHKLNTKTIQSKMSDIAMNNKLAEEFPMMFGDVEEEPEPVEIPVSEALEFMDQYADEFFGCDVHVDPNTFRNTAYDAIIYVYPNYTVRLGSISVNPENGELIEIIPSENYQEILQQLCQ